MQKNYCLESFYELVNCAIGTYNNTIILVKDELTFYHDFIQPTVRNTISHYI